MERINTNTFFDPGIIKSPFYDEAGVNEKCTIFNGKYVGHLPSTGCWIETLPSDEFKYFKIWGEGVDLSLSINLKTDIITMPDGTEIAADILISEYDALFSGQHSTFEPKLSPTPTLTETPTLRPTSTPRHLTKPTKTEEAVKATEDMGDDSSQNPFNLPKGIEVAAGVGLLIGVLVWAKEKIQKKSSGKSLFK